MGTIVTPAEERLARFREQTAELREQLWRDMVSELAREERIRCQRRGLPLSIRGGAPTLQTTLSVLRSSVTNNTFTTARSIIGTTAGVVTDASGPFSMDWFNVQGALWEQQAMGVISTTLTPTIAFRTAFGATVGAITTSLCTTATTTTASGLANIDWYYYVIGRTVAATGATSTTLATGFVLGQLNATAPSPFYPVKNATPPTAVTTDWSAGSVFLDLQATWGTSSVSNSVTVNHYQLNSLMN